jgi:hypothetical protein
MTRTNGGFRTHLCNYAGMIQILFMTCSLILILNTLSLLSVQPGSASYVVVAVNFVGLVPLTAGTGYMVLHCRNVPH